MTPEQIAAGLNEHHADVLDCLANGFPMKMATRHQDKVRRKLRQLGLIEHSGKPKRWQITELGTEARAYLAKHGAQ